MSRQDCIPLAQALEDGFVGVEALDASRVRVENRAHRAVWVRSGEPLGERPDQVARASALVPPRRRRTLETAPGAALRAAGRCGILARRSEDVMSDKSQERREAVERVVDGTTWRRFCRTLEEAGSIILDERAPQDPLDRAEGWRYLTRLTRAAFETFIEASDARAPSFRRTASETIKMGMDNPDNVYLNAPVRGTDDYRIRGQRGTVHYLGFGSQAGNYGSTGNLETTGYLEAKDMKIEADGSFEIIASSEEQKGDRVNWLPMRPDTRMIQIRQTRLDHAAEKLAEVTIERVGGSGQPQPLSPERLDRMLMGAGQFVKGCAGLFHQWALDWQAHTNELPRFDPDKAFAAGGDPHIAYYHSYWRLAPDEALVVEAMPPECDYWNFQLANHWLESLDYRFFRIHVNKHTAEYRPDGSVQVVVAHQDPGVPNWLDTCGHAHGTMCWRWIRAREHPQPQTRVVKLSELRGG